MFFIMELLLWYRHGSQVLATHLTYDLVPASSVISRRRSSAVNKVSAYGWLCTRISTSSSVREIGSPIQAASEMCSVTGAVDVVVRRCRRVHLVAAVTA